MDLHYGGAPNECGYHFAYLDQIVELNAEGDCPLSEEHRQYGPGSHFA